MRTHKKIIEQVQRAIVTNKPVKGIKGVSPLAKYVDLVDGMPVDYMHCVLEGIMDKLMNLWFASKNHRKPYYLNRKIKYIDKWLTSQKPPNEFTWSPRSISTHRNYWKASELKQWLLYYSLPILRAKLPPLYWHHFALLVCTVHILLKDKITYAELKATETMIEDFCILFKQLYGEINCTHNLHLLQHLPKYVKLRGPLWTHSTFCFENKNNLIKNLFLTEQLILVSKCYLTSKLNLQFNIFCMKSKFRMVNLWQNS